MSWKEMDGARDGARDVCGKLPIDVLRITVPKTSAELKPGDVFYYRFGSGGARWLTVKDDPVVSTDHHQAVLVTTLEEGLSSLLRDEVWRVRAR